MRLKRKIILLTFGLTGLILYACYFWIGYQSLRAMPATLLIDFSLYPENISSRWILIPFKGKIALDALIDLKPEQIQEDFKRHGRTLYSGIVGYRKVTDPVGSPRASNEAVLVRQIASFIYQSGVKLSWRDTSGCTAIHQALIESDISSAKYLLELAAKEQVGPNPAASYKLCRLDVAGLAAEKGLSFP